MSNTLAFVFRQVKGAQNGLGLDLRSRKAALNVISSRGEKAVDDCALIDELTGLPT
jgi:hypothetical protein